MEVAIVAEEIFVHVVHIIVDGQIDTPRLREFERDRPSEAVIPPSAIADAVIPCMRNLEPLGPMRSTFDLRSKAFDVIPKRSQAGNSVITRIGVTRNPGISKTLHANFHSV
jgi:hypothetical protein